jgi:outer membrane protein assembly factor BamA
MHSDIKPLFKAVRMLVLLLLVVLGRFNALSQTDSARQYVTIGSVGVEGNVKTREPVIFRELLFARGSTYSQSEFCKRVNQSRLNLLNTSLFNFVTIDTLPGVDAEAQVVMTVTITVLERWYLWPVPILQITDRNFNTWLQTHDYTRINYGLDVKWYNFTGRMDELDAVAQFGKNHRLSLAYRNPYIDKHKHFGLGLEAGYRKNRETGYVTRNDKLVFLFTPEGVSEEKYLALDFTWRNNIFITHQLTAGFRTLSLYDSLLLLNPDYSYTDLKETEYVNIHYKLKIDHRDIKYYPLKGWYADLELDKAGVGFGFEKPVDIASAKSTVRLYSSLAKRWYAGISVAAKVSSAAWQPYFLMQGLGYNRDYVRGYEYNVIDGKHFGLVRSNIKFALVPERTHKIGFIPSPKFGRIHFAMYVTAFADAGYVWQPQWIGQNNNSLPATLMAGGGIGVDIVTYYDKVVRIEYAVSRTGESGIFIHFVAGI